MLDQGFLSDSQIIVKICPDDTPLALFSATVSQNVQSLMNSLFSRTNRRITLLIVILTMFSMIGLTRLLAQEMLTWDPEEYFGERGMVKLAKVLGDGFAFGGFAGAGFAAGDFVAPAGFAGVLSSRSTSSAPFNSSAIEKLNSRKSVSP